MRLKVKLVGAGTNKDPIRATLPTYTMILDQPEEKWAIVEVPDEVHGLTEADLSHEKLHTHEDGEHYETLCADCVEKAHAYFDNRYQEHKGKFRLDFVK